jgi:phenylalanyl-tRNA synthetase beta chain
MKISLEWLKKYVDLSDVPAVEVEKILPVIGHEIETIEFQGMPPLKNVVVGQILTKGQHPNADRLTLCTVKISNHENQPPLQIVCGAKNHKEGDFVVVALEGSVLPGGFEIKKSKLRGVDSCGMMCSARELGMCGDHEGIIILQGSPKLGISVNDLFTDSDVVLDLELTSNRGDCLCHVGVARELAAYLSKELKVPSIKHPLKTEKQAGVDALIKGLHVEAKACPYYTTWSIKGVKVGESPEWLKKSLEKVGVNSVNNVVDATNYVMLEMGQPLHAFDAKKIKGHELIVRQAKTGETLNMLDGKTRKLRAEDMVIADKERALVLAGVMGSKEAEVDASTTDIVLESAYFNPDTVRRSARYHGLSTDSSHRFERDVDPSGVVAGALRAIDLIIDVAGGHAVAEGIEVGEPGAKGREIELTPDYVRSVCGFDVADDIIWETLERLQFTLKEKDKETWKVWVPSVRRDVDRPIDLVEEFVRIYGTDKIPLDRVRFRDVNREDDPKARFTQRVVRSMIGRSFQECINYTLRSEEHAQLFEVEHLDALAVANPLVSYQTHLRPSLLLGLVDNLKLNLWNSNDVRKLFEYGHVFRVNKNGISEVYSVAFVMLQNPSVRQWMKPVPNDFYTAKEIALNLIELAGLPKRACNLKPLSNHAFWQDGFTGTAGDIYEDDFNVTVGMLHSNIVKKWGLENIVWAGEIQFGPELFKENETMTSFVEVNEFASVSRDLAMVVDATLLINDVYSDVEAIAKKCVQGFYLEDLNLFDIYEGENLPVGKKGLAFELAFRAADKTLTDDEVNPVFQKIIAELEKTGRYTIRQG